jgi:hypothetical protein
MAIKWKLFNLLAVGAQGIVKNVGAPTSAKQAALRLYPELA